MSVVDLQELDEVKGLLAKGQQVGVLSYTEISKAMSELDLDESDVEELHGFFERAEIELVEDIDPAIAASAQVERAPDKRGRRKAKTALDLKPDMTDEHGFFLDRVLQQVDLRIDRNSALPEVQIVVGERISKSAICLSTRAPISSTIRVSSRRSTSKALVVWSVMGAWSLVTSVVIRTVP